MIGTSGISIVFCIVSKKPSSAIFQESQGAVSPTREQARKEAERKMQRYTNKQKLVGTTMEAIQATTEPIDEQDHLP